MSTLLFLMITICVAVCMGDGSTLIFRGDVLSNKEENAVQTQGLTISRLNQVDAPKSKTMDAVPISIPNTNGLDSVLPVPAPTALPVPAPTAPPMPPPTTVPVPTLTMLPVIGPYTGKKKKKGKHSSRKAIKEHQIGEQLDTGKVKAFY